MATTTAAILEAIAARIEALAPDASVTEDDVFRATVGDRSGNRGGRAVYVSGQGGRRRPTGGQTCSDWETVVTVEMVYPNLPPEEGTRGTYARALEDSEDVLDDLYTWSVSADSILKIEPDLADVVEDGNGNLVVSRTIGIQFTR